MPDPTIDIKVSISSDATVLTIEDDTIGWGTIAKDDITASELNIYSDAAHTDLIKQITTLLTENSVEIDFDTDEDFQTLGTYLPDGVYYYDLTYTYATGTLTKDDGVFYSTKIVEGNIDDDLLTFLTGVQAYNYKMEYPLLEEIRRRSNILDAINDAEFLSEIDNVENLLSLLQRLE